MKKQRTSSIYKLIAAFSLVAIVPLTQITKGDVTPPAGYLNLTFKALSDTPFSLPLNRPKVYSGQVDSVLENTISIAASELTASAFLYADGSQNEKYYLLFTTGVLEGRSFDITTNGNNSITLVQDGLIDVQDLINDANAHDLFEIRPHWTLDTLFPNGAGYPQVTNAFENGSTILFRATSTSGINLSPQKTYKYATGTGWVDNANLFAGRVKDVVLIRNGAFIARNVTASDVVKGFVGDVPTSDARARIKGNVIKQDSHASFTFPIDISLAQTGLASSPGFDPSAGQFDASGDIVYLYNVNLAGYNKAPSTSYYYVTGLGWINSANVFAGAVNASNVIFKAGTTFMIRKAADLSASTYHHGTALPYNPFAE